MNNIYRIIRYLVLKRKSKSKKKKKYASILSLNYLSIFFLILIIYTVLDAYIIEPYILKHGDRTIGYVYAKGVTKHVEYNLFYYIVDGKEYRAHGGEPSRVVKIAYLPKCPRLYAMVYEEEPKIERADKGSSKGKHRNRNVE